MLELTLQINGFALRATYSDIAEATIGHIICRMRQMLRQPSRAGIVYLVAPPGAGKSTFARALEYCAQAAGVNARALGLDGFHYANAYLASHRSADGDSLLSIKGAPETYDVAALSRHIDELKSGRCSWPEYDRRIHDVAPNANAVSGDIFIIEGNWLRLDAPLWREIASKCDLSISISAPENLLLQRLIARKMRGGLDEKNAQSFVMRSDLANIRAYYANLLPADIALIESEHAGAVSLTPT